MPYPNWHAARIRQPGRFLRIRVLKVFPNGIMLYGGPLKTDPRGGAKTQSYRFPRKKFTAVQAKQWLRKHKIKWIRFEAATGGD